MSSPGQSLRPECPSMPTQLRTACSARHSRSRSRICEGKLYSLCSASCPIQVVHRQDFWLSLAVSHLTCFKCVRYDIHVIGGKRYHCCREATDKLSGSVIDIICSQFRASMASLNVRNSISPQPYHSSESSPILIFSTDCTSS